ncbi:DNA polymerase IV [Lacihabitans lacunae]|uniref:DNA polymerase IV n=1 Tax=Lacihabitans lacunae TaxID=1028214 RepID=A0ABV7Z067_9BACT
MQKKIIHIDMDAFFASVEQRDNPDLRGKPVAVGGSADRGVVAAASYEARKFGVRSALPSVTAKRLCPSLIFVKPRFEVYKEVSRQIREIFAEYTDLIEPLSLDEAYLDVTENKQNNPIATEIAFEIRTKIFEKTGLTASAGISYNKFLAKTASDINKPNGQCVIKPSQAEAFVEKLPIHKFYGIRKVTAEKMISFGIFTGKQLKEQSLEFLKSKFGKVGSYYYEIARGQDRREVSPSRETKSISVENTFSEDLIDVQTIKEELFRLSESLLKRIAKYNFIGKTLTIKIKYEDFESITRSKTYESGYLNKDQIDQTVDFLIDNLVPFPKGIRLLGIGLSNFLEENQDKQLRIGF